MQLKIRQSISIVTAAYPDLISRFRIGYSISRDSLNHAQRKNARIGTGGVASKLG
jgi:hypothetical protein